MGRIPTKQNPNPWKEDSSDKKKRKPPPRYDILIGDIPYESSYPKTRHPRLTCEWFKIEDHISEACQKPWKDLPLPKGKIIDEFDQCVDKDLARLVDNLFRAHWILNYMINQPLSEKLLHYYVYVPLPCRFQLLNLYQGDEASLSQAVGPTEWSGMWETARDIGRYGPKPLMELIITDMTHRYSKYADQVERLCMEVLREATEADEYFGRLAELTPDYWNERNYDTPITKFRRCLKKLFDELNHIGQLLEKDLAAETPVETKQNRKTTIVAIIISLIVDLLFELLVYFIPITWVKNHPNSYGLQGSIIFLIPCLIVGLFKPQYRKWCWGVGAIAFIVLLLSLMGGPADSNVN